ncbi:MAG: ABC transporter ATP-binding protein [Candidatus Dormiibacterota bacterium]
MVASISASGLTKDFGEGHGIFDLDLEIEPGDVFGLIGPNGAGKSTTIRLLMDFIRPTRGTATVAGLDTRRDSLAIKQLVGYVPGELPDYPQYTGAALLQLLANLRGHVDGTRIIALANRFELDLNRKYREYSHGNKQKIALVQAFMHNPRALILDEPTLGLDPLMQQEFQELVHEAASTGATIFLSSHVLSEVQELCDRIGIVAGGRLRTEGTLESLREVHVHRVDVWLRDDPPPSGLADIPGVSDLKLVDHHVFCRMQGDFGPFIAALEPAGILELDSEEMSLEEVFLAHHIKVAGAP